MVTASPAATRREPCTSSSRATEDRFPAPSPWTASGREEVGGKGPEDRFLAKVSTVGAGDRDRTGDLFLGKNLAKRSMPVFG